MIATIITVIIPQVFDVHAVFFLFTMRKRSKPNAHTRTQKLPYIFGNRRNVYCQYL